MPACGSDVHTYRQCAGLDHLTPMLVRLLHVQDNLVIGPIDVPCSGSFSGGAFDGHTCDGQTPYAWQYYADQVARQVSPSVVTTVGGDSGWYVSFVPFHGCSLEPEGTTLICT